MKSALAVHLFLGATSLIGLPAVASNNARRTAAPPAAEEVTLADDLRTVRTFARSVGDRLWTGYGESPFGALLILPSGEVLLCQHEVPPGFVKSPTAEAGCDRSARPRSALPDNLLAAMGVFGPRQTIVMGTPETTGRTHAEWLRTVLHEHFHQWQSSRPGYYTKVQALGLAGDDSSGMWMLNFPFPYDDKGVGAAFERASLSLAKVVSAGDRQQLRTRFRAYLAARRELELAAGARNWRYAEFQLWQEGVARWTEIQLGKRFPLPAVRQAAEALEQTTLDQLAAHDLAGQRRTFVYDYGAAEAMLIDRCDPAWRKGYVNALSLGGALKRAARMCGAE